MLDEGKDIENRWNEADGGKSKNSEQTPVPLWFRPPQIQHGLAWIYLDLRDDKPVTNHLCHGMAQMEVLMQSKRGTESTINGDHTKSIHGLFFEILLIISL